MAARGDRALGQMTDAEVARRTNRRVNAVGAARKKRGIPAQPRAIKRGPWTEAERKLFGKVPDAEIARRFGRTASQVSNSLATGKHVSSTYYVFTFFVLANAKNIRTKRDGMGEIRLKDQLRASELSLAGRNCRNSTGLTGISKSAKYERVDGKV